MPLRLDVQHAGEQRAGLGDDEAARLEKQTACEAGESAIECGGVFLYFGGGIEVGVVVVDAETTAGVDGADFDADAGELMNQRVDALESCAEGIGGADLGADVDTDSMGIEPAVAGGALVDREGAANVDAELVLAETCRDVGMRFGEDVGIDAQSEAGAGFELAGALGEKIELLLALDVELQDAGAQSLVDFIGRFADAGEDDALHGFGSSGEDAIQFAAGDDVEACAVIGEELEDGEVRVGFDRIADQVIARGERVLKKREALKDLVGRVDVERRAEFAGEGFEGNLAATESAFGAGMLKRASRSGGRSSTFGGQHSVSGQVPERRTVLSVPHAGVRGLKAPAPSETAPCCGQCTVFGQERGGASS